MAKEPKQEEKKPVTTAGQDSLDTTPPVVVDTGPDKEAEISDLKKQLAAMRRNEEAARQQAAQIAQQRDQALQVAQQRSTELSRSMREATDSRLEAITNGIAAAEAETQEAKKAYQIAIAEGDIEAQVSAQERLAEAKANHINLSNGKAALEQQIKENEERQKQLQAQHQAQQRIQQQQPGDQLDRTNLPDTAKKWLRAHPEYLTDNRKNAKIQSLHWDVLDEGHEPFSDAYYESLEQHLGLRSKPKVEAQDIEELEEETPIVSAPVSREAPSSGGRQLPNPKEMRLTAAEREIAKMSGLTDTEYAKHKVELLKQKANGNYGGQP